MKLDIYATRYYEHDKPALVERTKLRLAEIAECEMTEVGYGNFGYESVMSGLYIERIWTLSNADFRAYMDWATDLIYKLNNN